VLKPGKKQREKGWAEKTDQNHKKGQRRTLNPLVSLVAGEGFEPTTFGL
jgi:hypothetical protein